MNEKQQPKSQKPRWRLSQAKYHRWEFLLSRLPIKKMATEVLLILSLYLILPFVWSRFRHLIRIMSNVETILNDDDFFGDIVDTPKEGIEQNRKRECLKSVINKGKAHLLGHKWTPQNVDKASNETISKIYDAYKQRELNEKGEKTGKIMILCLVTGYKNF